MKKNPQEITISGVTTLIKYLVFGILSGEVVCISRIIAGHLSVLIDEHNFEYQSIFISLIILLLVVTYLIVRDAKQDLVKVLGSLRIDIYGAFLGGLWISIYWGGIWSAKYVVLFDRLGSQKILFLSLIFLAIVALFVVQMLIGKRSENDQDSFFLDDLACEDPDEDLLAYRKKADAFAERVINQGSRESIVFGIDAPWGIGKSSFVNFCKKYWENNNKKDLIVYSFDPLRYEDSKDLLQKFIDGLVVEIQKEVFMPEIRTVVSRYSRFIKAIKGKINFLNLEWDVLSGTYTIDDAFDDLQRVFLKMDKKVVIIIDDLDRLNFEAVKDILYVVKKSFIFKNVSYILCYDSDNISLLEKDLQNTEKITEFFEKFINVKISLFLSSEVLRRYVSESLREVLSGNSQADPKLVGKVLEGLLFIYDGNDYDSYLPFVGDVRKLKRLINVILLLDIEKVDFEFSDINTEDLINLLFIYINYPNTFRKIYNCETTQQRRGFFSVKLPYEKKDPEDMRSNPSEERDFKTSKFFDDFTKSLEADQAYNQAFLLKRVFDVKSRLNRLGFDANQPDSVPTELTSSLACFNGHVWTGGGRNLEGYLELIVNSSKPQKIKQYQFYLNFKKALLEGKKEIGDIFQEQEFSNEFSEESHEHLWRIIINSISEFNRWRGGKIITYLVENIQNYSFFSSEDLQLGLRADLNLYLTRLLNNAGWGNKAKDAEPSRDNSNYEKVKEIAEWILGENEHTADGILASLARPEKGILGLYDLLLFRLFCSADRKGEAYTLHKSLAQHGNPDAPTQGLLSNIAKEEMREISQKTFSVFKEQYISTEKNIFSLIDALTLEDVTGNYSSFVLKKIELGEVKLSEVDKGVLALKSKLTTFIPYQLGNSMIDLGVGCGFYDESGVEDGKGIKEALSRYLFSVCFNPQLDIRNYKYFIDYCLKMLASDWRSFDREEDGWKPSLSELTKVIDEDQLREYWTNNKDAIKTQNYHQSNEKLLTLNSELTYSKHLPIMYEYFDTLIENNNTSEGLATVTEPVE